MRSDVVILPYVVQMWFHEGDGSTRVVTGDGMAKDRDIFFFNVENSEINYEC